MNKDHENIDVPMITSENAKTWKIRTVCSLMHHQDDKTRTNQKAQKDANPGFKLYSREHSGKLNP